jgi:hypothetical protein
MEETKTRLAQVQAVWDEASTGERKEIREWIRSQVERVVVREVESEHATPPGAPKIVVLHADPEHSADGRRQYCRESLSLPREAAKVERLPIARHPGRNRLP